MTTLEADVCVVGGGAAGMSAATVAAGLGARTVLLEESSVLGGNVTRGLVSLDRVAWGGELMVGGWFADLIRRLERQGDALFPGPATHFTTPCDADALRTMALALAHEAGVDVRFGSKVTWAEVADRRVTSVWAREHGSLVQVSAPLFIDCTGDGNLGHMAGCSYWLGDRDEGSIQGQTLIFCVAPVDFERLAEYARAEGSQVETYRVVGLRGFMRDLRSSGEVEGSPQEGLLIDRNMWPNMVSISGSETYGDHLRPGGLSEIVAELERQNRQIHQALYSHVPGFEGSRIVRTADRPYLREGRRLTGYYQLSARDIQKALKPADSIARGYYPVDLHRDGKVGIVQAVYLSAGDWYGIPYRCIVAQDVDNLLMAGRCISVTHEALGLDADIACLHGVGTGRGHRGGAVHPARECARPTWPRATYGPNYIDKEPLPSVPDHTVFVTFGTRPEAIKMAPVVLELQRRGVFRVVTCLTGQHREMLDQVIEAFSLPVDHDLKIMRERQTLGHITSAVLNGIDPLLEGRSPTW